MIGALAVVGPAAAADIGANDDTGKYAPDAGAAFYAEMSALGLRQAVVTVRWQPSDPLGLAERPLLDLTVAGGSLGGTRRRVRYLPVPARARSSPGSRGPSPSAHGSRSSRTGIPRCAASWSATSRTSLRSGGRSSRRHGSAPRRRSVRSWRRVTTPSRRVDPTMTVVGVGLSPRGNDRPLARSNVSTSPVRFLAALGAWYRASGRDRPLMDGLSFHPYPNRATDALVARLRLAERRVREPRPHQAGRSGTRSLARRSPQPSRGSGCTSTRWAGRSRPRGTRDTPAERTCRSRASAHQAEVYGEVVRRAACDPDVAQVNIFGFRDDVARSGFQAGLHRVDGTGRPAAYAVRAALLEPRACMASAWRPARAVLGARPPKMLVVGTRVTVQLRRPRARSLAPACCRARTRWRLRGACLPRAERSRGMRSRSGAGESRRDASPATASARPHARRSPLGRGEPVADDDLRPPRPLSLDTEHVFCHHGNRCSHPPSSGASRFSRSPRSCSGRCSRARPAHVARSAAIASSRATRSGRSRSVPSSGDPREGVWELRERNRLDSAVIAPGQVLVLPS